MLNINGLGAGFNPRPLPCEGNALPSELPAPRKRIKFLYDYLFDLNPVIILLQFHSNSIFFLIPFFPKYFFLF